MKPQYASFDKKNIYLKMWKHTVRNKEKNQTVKNIYYQLGEISHYLPPKNISHCLKKISINITKKLLYHWKTEMTQRFLQRIGNNPTTETTQYHCYHSWEILF